MELGLERIEIFLITYACLVVSTVLVMSYLSVTQIDVYVAALAIEYFVAILATSPHTPGETRRERVLGVMLMVVFAAIVVERVIALLK